MFSQRRLWISKRTATRKWSMGGGRDRHFRGDEVSEGNRTHVMWKRLLDMAGEGKNVEKEGERGAMETNYV